MNASSAVRSSNRVLPISIWRINTMASTAIGNVRKWATSGNGSNATAICCGKQMTAAVSRKSRRWRGCDLPLGQKTAKAGAIKTVSIGRENTVICTSKIVLNAIGEKGGALL